MADYELSGNVLTFKRDVSKWSNGPTQIDSNQFTFTNCTITSGISITFDFSESTSITVSNCTINKSCTIGFNITNCSYDSDGTLIINGSQFSPFKFNKINIRGNSSAINIRNGQIIISSDDHELNIISGNYGIYNNNGTTTINNSGLMTISGSNSDGIYNSVITTINNSGLITISGKSSGINNSGSMTINNSGSMTISGNNGISNIGIIIINNYGTISITSNYNYGIYNYRSMIIDNYGSITISGNNNGIANNKTLTFNNSSINNLNLSNGFQSYEITTINISDSLFLIESSSTLTSIGFTSTPSTWNGITFTNSSSLSGFSKVLVDLNHYFKPQSPFSNYLEYPKQITLQSGEQYFCNKLKNDSEESLSFELEPRGTLILQPHSSLEVSDHFELPEESTLIVSGEAKINDSLIRGQSAILLSSELNGRVLNNCNCTF